MIHAQDLALKTRSPVGTQVQVGDEKVRLALGICAGRGNLSEAARHLGIARSTLYRKLTRIGWNQLDRDALLERAEQIISK